MELALDDPRWLAFVRAHPQAGPFHHPAWTSLLAECYGFRPFALAVLDDAGAVAAGLPAVEERGRRISLPFTDVCAPLARTDDARRKLARTVAAHERFEVHGTLTGAGLTVRRRALTHLLELEPGVECGFRAQMRRNAARAEREGVVVRRGESRADLVDVFYRLHVQTRRRQGVPVQPRRFFRLLWDGVLEPGLGTLFVAYAGATPVAAAVFLAWNGTAVYKFGASDEAHWRLRPNNLLFREAIAWACASGCAQLDFGRTEVAHRGLREFKRGWGAREQPLVYTYAGPVPGTREHRVLAATIRRSPPWLCRTVGELAYRYAA